MPQGINTGEILEALNDKMDRDGHNVQSPTAFIVETYSNGTDWYRVWSDGWCEQGGQSSTYANATATTFLKPFIDTNYTILTNVVLNGNSAYHIVVYQKNTSDFTTYYYQAQARVDFSWKAEGYIS